LFKYIIASLPVTAEIDLQEIGKEENPEYKKHNEELYHDDDPYSFSPP
jgi:hypothetical protein